MKIKLALTALALFLLPVAAHADQVTLAGGFVGAAVQASRRRHSRLP